MSDPRTTAPESDDFSEYRRLIMAEVVRFNDYMARAEEQRLKLHEAVSQQLNQIRIDAAKQTGELSQRIQQLQHELEHQQKDNDELEDTVDKLTSRITRSEQQQLVAKGKTLVLNIVGGAAVGAIWQLFMAYLASRGGH